MKPACSNLDTTDGHMRRDALDVDIAALLISTRRKDWGYRLWGRHGWQSKRGRERPLVCWVG